MDRFGALTSVNLQEGKTYFYSLAALDKAGITGLDRLPFSIRILLENAVRQVVSIYREELAKAT